ncbi:MAG: hypothetical protein ACQETI_07975 [Halobacteriota archaeon]
MDWLALLSTAVVVGIAIVAIGGVVTLLSGAFSVPAAILVAAFLFALVNGAIGYGLQRADRTKSSYW